MALEPDPYRTLGLTRRRDARRGQARLPAAGQGQPPRRGRRGGAAALPRDPGRLRAARRARQRARDGGRRRPARPWDAEADATRRAYGGRARTRRRERGHGRRRRYRDGRAAGTAGTGAGRRPAAPGEASGGRHDARRPAGRTGGGVGRPGRRRPTAARRLGDAGTTAARPTTRAPNKATLGSTSYDGADPEPFEPDWGGAQLVRHDERHVLDDQPEGIRRPAQARAGVPGPRPAGGPRRVAPDPSTPGAATPRRTPRQPGDPGDAAADPATASRPPARPTRRRRWWDSTAGPAGPDGRTTPPARPGSFDASAAGAATGDASGPGRPSRATEPRTGEPPPPDLGRAAADIRHALTDDRFGGVARRDSRGAHRLAADRPRPRLAGRRDDRLRPVRRDLRRRRRRADARRPADPRASPCSSLSRAAGVDRDDRPPRPRSRPRSSASLVLSATGGARGRRFPASCVLGLVLLPRLARRVWPSPSAAEPATLGPRASPVS